MTRSDVVDAMLEAERFLDRARELLSATSDTRYGYHPSKEASAVKRASMDLTRALSKMRAG